MSDWPWSSPEATRRALSDRIRRAYPVAERPARMREVAYRRLLARLFAARPDSWVLKGGVALLLRLDPNRSSNDVDLAFIAEAGQSALAQTALRSDAALPLADFFRFDIGAATTRTGRHAPEGGVSVVVDGDLGRRPWARFTVDLAPPRADVPVTALTRQTSLTGIPAVDEVPG